MNLLLFLNKGDVSDLDLTFSVDEDLMGRIITHELVPGGRLQPVTNENRLAILNRFRYEVFN